MHMVKRKYICEFFLYHVTPRSIYSGCVTIFYQKYAQLWVNTPQLKFESIKISHFSITKGMIEDPLLSVFFVAFTKNWRVTTLNKIQLSLMLRNPVKVTLNVRRAFERRMTYEATHKTTQDILTRHIIRCTTMTQRHTTTRYDWRQLNAEMSHCRSAID